MKMIGSRNHLEKRKSFEDRIIEFRQLESFISSTDKILPSDLLNKTSIILLAAGIDFAEAGSFARSMYVEVMVTADVNVVVGSENIMPAEKALHDAGFAFKQRLEHRLPKKVTVEFEFMGRKVYIVGFPEHPEFADFLLKTSAKRTLLDTSYSFLGLEGLVITRLCGFRYKDKADLVDLKKTKPDLDVVRSWCSTLRISDRVSFMKEDTVLFVASDS